MKLSEGFNQYIYDGGLEIGFLYIHAKSREDSDLIFEDLYPTSFIFNNWLTKASSLLIDSLRELFPGSDSLSLFAFYDESKFSVVYSYAIDRIDAENKKLSIDFRSFKFEKEISGEILDRIVEKIHE